MFTVATACLDEAQAIALARGELAPAQRAALAAHVDGCDSCRQVLAVLVRDGSEAHAVGSDATLRATPPADAIGRARTELALGTTGATMGARTERVGDERPWRAGQRIGRYVIGDSIGRGGMGAVFRAEDVELGRGVALKRLHAGAGGDERARLFREARAAAQLQHPNVVTVYEVGEADGAPFLAMELVDGETLRAWLKQPRTQREIVRMLVQAGRGLAAAHERGLVHRDFKPDNVLVDRSGRARVADFGLARASDGPTGASEGQAGEASGTGSQPDPRLARMTATGTLGGTPAYMAPELVEGAAPDARSDQYAFAITAFEALHGQHPFAGTTVEALWMEMAQGRIREGGAKVPAWLERHVRRGLAVEPAARWPDIASFVAALARPPRRAWMFAAGGSAVTAAALALVLVRGGGSAGPRCDEAGGELDGLWPGRRAAIELALGPDRSASVLAAVDRFGEGWRDGSRVSCRATAQGTQSADLADRRTACLDRARIRLQVTLDGIAGDGVGDAQAAVDSLPDLSACADLDQLRRTDPPPVSASDRAALATAETELARAISLRDHGDHAGALETVARARAIADKLVVRPLVARAALAAHDLELDRGDTQAAAADAFAAWTAASAAGERDLTLTAQLHLIAAEAGSNPSALDAFAGLPGDLPVARESAAIYQALGETQLRVGRYADAEKTFARAQAILAKLLPPNHFDRLVADYRVAGAQVMQRHATQALPELTRVHTELERIASPYRREAIDALHALGMAHEQLGHASDAISAHREVLARRTTIFGAHAPITANGRLELSTALSSAGKHEEAVTELETLIADHLAVHGEKSVNAADARVNLGVELTALARYAEAETAILRARPVLVKSGGEDHPNVAIADLALATARVRRAARGERVALPEIAASLDHARRVFTTAFGAHSQPSAVVDQLTGELEAVRGHWPAALAAFERCLATIGPSAKLADRAEVIALRARALWRLGKQAEARAAAADAEQLYAKDPARYERELRTLRAWIARPS